MKNFCFQMSRRAWLAVIAAVCFSMPALAQKITVSGTVTDSEGEPLIGASVIVQGQSGVGTATDLDGAYRLQVDPNATLVFSYVGCNPVTEAVNGRHTVNVTLSENTVMLNEVVAIGYGVVKKSDATGSVAVVKPNDIEAGLATSVQDMLVGQTPGVVVTTSGGPEGSGAIRIRGGSSLNASNDPLIVIDGVPLDNGSVQGMGNPLSMISPENIESMTILKDASATAIYGSRASNGVIIVTTKKGKAGKAKVNFTANLYVDHAAKQWDVLSSSEYVNFIKNHFGVNSDAAKRLGYNGKMYDTNWQDEVLRTAVSSDYSLSVAGATPNMPYRVDASYTNSNGILKGSQMNRFTMGFSLAPKFFDNHLSVNANARGYYIRNHFSDTGAVGAALAFDPTKPVFSNIPLQGGANRYLYGGYFTWFNVDKDNQVVVEQNASKNPLAMIKSRDNYADIYRSNGNLQLDYSFHFLPELHANLNLGYDISKTDETNRVAEGSQLSYWEHRKDGAGFENQIYQFKSNTLLDFYLNYRKEFKTSMLDVTAGYSWQRFSARGHNWGAASEPGRPTSLGYNLPTVNNGIYSVTYNEDTRSSLFKNYADDSVNKHGNYHWSNRLQLLSFFGRVNYTLKDRYLATVTVRGDATSRFSKENRWGLFPAVALGWRISEESFMEGTHRWLNDLKLRLGWGKTGQQDVGSTCNYLPLYLIGSPGSYYPVVDADGNTTYIPALFLQGYNPDLKWETTTTYNVGLDFGFLNNRINGSIEYYRRKTTDLLSFVTIPAGSSTVNMLNRNIGTLENYGVEFNITARPVVTKNFTWTISYNVGWNHNEITELNDKSSYVPVGGISGGTGNTVQAHAVGHPASSFYLLQQVYDKAGKPIEGLFVDQDGNGQINSDDKVISHSPDPKVTMTMSNQFRYKNWDFGFSLRASIGNYVYNNVLASNSAISSLATYGLSNVVKTDYYFQDKSAANYYMSNYFLENASFLRCDNITLGYSWEGLHNGDVNLRLYGAVQNPFVITKYSGVDPEVFGGIDNNVYPRSRTYTVGLVVSF